MYICPNRPISNWRQFCFIMSLSVIVFVQQCLFYCYYTAVFIVISVCIYGGGSRREQINIVSKGVEIVIGQYKLCMFRGVHSTRTIYDVHVHTCTCSCIHVSTCTLYMHSCTHKAFILENTGCISLKSTCIILVCTLYSGTPCKGHLSTRDTFLVPFDILLC